MCRSTHTHNELVYTAIINGVPYTRSLFIHRLSRWRQCSADGFDTRSKNLDQTPECDSSGQAQRRCMDFMAKAVYNDVSYSYIELLAYSCARYFFWFLITGKWTMCSLLRHNTKRFFAALFQSQCACWIEFFRLPQYKGFDKYYL